MRTLTILFGLALAMTGPAAYAAGDAAAGKAKAETCKACHGENGNTMGADGKPQPTFPRLAGQHASYIERALEDYKTGKRKNAIMAGFATALSAQDRADLAAYYSKMPGGLGKIDLSTLK